MLEQYPCALTHEHCSNSLLEKAIRGFGDSTKTDRALTHKRDLLPPQLHR